MGESPPTLCTSFRTCIPIVHKMADRFPSIEDIDSGETEARGTTGFESAGEGSFLDRERAVLGEDADQFGSAPDHTNSATVQEDDGDLLGGDDIGAEQRASTVQDGMNEFESSFPAIDTQNEVSRISPDRKQCSS